MSCNPHAVMLATASCIALHSQPMTKSDLISTGEAAALLEIDRSTLSRWITLGYLKPAIRTSARGAMFFHRHDIKALKKSERVRAAHSRAKASA